MDDKGIRRCGGRDGLGEGKIKGVDDDWVRDNGREMIIGQYINIILAREGIGGAHLRARSDHPFDVKVLKK